MTRMNLRYDRYAVGREMRRQGLRAQDLARRARASRQHVSFIVRGMVDPRASSLARLASALGVGIESFFITRES
jgi:transcriptional regulator with XRE-family HTH domain